MAQKQHFVLVHGACHGAWCWYKLEQLLSSAGHKVTSLDMAACGIDPRHYSDLKNMYDYFEPLTTFMESVEEKVILVGHSFGGLGVTMSMETFSEKIYVAIFVTAAMPKELGKLNQPSLWREINKAELHDQMENEFGPDGSMKFGPKFMSVHLYQNSPPRDVTLAARLVRPKNMLIGANMAILPELTEKNYGSVSRAYIITEEDMMGTKEWQLKAIEVNPPDKVYEIKGADHMVMVSKPQELYACFQEIVECFT